MKTFLSPIKSILKMSVLLCFLSYFSFVYAAALDHGKNKFISYTDIGKGQPLILIHAFPTDQSLWGPQLVELSKYFRVIALDLWGFGRSPSVDGQAISMTRYADEVKQLMDKLHIKKAIIGGESMGGYIALAFLEKYPDQVNGLILSDTQSIADTAEASAKREATAKDILKNGTANLIDNFLPKALSINASEQLKTTLRQILEAQSATGMASALRGMGIRSDTSTVLQNSNLPILIITGNQDAVISSQQSKNMHALAKNSQLVEIADAGHLSNLEQPALWNQAVIDMFYDRH